MTLLETTRRIPTAVTGAPAATDWVTYWDDPRARRRQQSGSALARWVDVRLPAGEAIVDLGCGTGRDAIYLARQGRPVLAADIAPAALGTVHARARVHEVELAVRRLDLTALADVMVAGAELARTSYHLYARQLLGCLDHAGRANLWLLARMALRGRGVLVLEFSATGPATSPAPAGLVARVDPAVVRREVVAAGGRVDRERVTAGVDLLGRRDPRVCRMVLSWPGRA
jgi:SAM-dependent methyltransferase